MRVYFAKKLSTIRTSPSYHSFSLRKHMHSTSPSVTALPHSHCHFCGIPYDATQLALKHRTCSSCCKICYRNPLPVAVVLLPVDTGLLLIRRNNQQEQGYGKWALPGGFVEIGETAQEAAARELFEETDIRVSSSELEAFHAASAPPSLSTLLLVFFVRSLRYPPLRAADLVPFRLNSEVSERRILLPGEWRSNAAVRADIAFDTHADAIERFFSRT